MNNLFDFVDMYVERNYLFTNVYPKLQKFCQLEYNLEFQVRFLFYNGGKSFCHLDSLSFALRIWPHEDETGQKNCYFPNEDLLSAVLKM